MGKKGGGGSAPEPVLPPATPPARAPLAPDAKAATATATATATDKKAAAAARKSIFFDSESLGTGAVNPVSVLAQTLGGR